MHRSLFAILAFSLGLSFLPGPIHAQVSRADSAAVLLQAARAFEAEGRDDVSRALLQYVSERFGNTPAGLRAVEMLRTAPEEGSGTGSQVELMVWGTLYGTWLGVAIPGAFGSDDPTLYGLGLLAGAPAGLLAGRAVGKSRSLSEGQVRAITFGGTWGTWQGYGWTEVFDLGTDEVCYLDECYVNDPDGETLLKGMIVGGLAGITTGAIMARNPIPAGVATSANFGGLWGSWFGFGAGYLADRDEKEDRLLAITLITGNLGILGGALLGHRWELSRPRARLISIAGVLGGLAGGGLDLIIRPDDSKVALGIPLATSIAGLVAGTVLTSDERDIPDWARGGDASSPLDGALFHYGRGGLKPGIPAPFVTSLPVERAGRRGWEPGIGVTLFSARF